MNAKDLYPGLKVRFRQWEDMRAEFGGGTFGESIPTPASFISDMRFLCGHTAYVLSSDEHGVDGVAFVRLAPDPYDTINPINLNGFVYDNYMLEPADEEAYPDEYEMQDPLTLF